MNNKQIDQTITVFQIGAVLCPSLAAMFYALPILDYLSHYYDYLNQVLKVKPDFPILPPLIIAAPFFLAGVAFFFGAKLLKHLKGKDQNSNSTKFLVSLAFIIPLFSFGLFGYLFDHLPLKYKKIFGAQSFEQVFTPIEQSIIEDAGMGIQIPKPLEWHAYWMDLNSKKALLIRRNEIKKDERIETAPYFMLIKYGTISEQPPGQVAAGMRKKFSKEFTSYAERSNQILNILNYPAIKVTSAYEVNGFPYHLEYWVMERNGFTYLIYFATPENQKENISVFEELVKNTTFY